MNFEKDQAWRLGKEIPVATIVVLLLQTAGVIWWAASTSARVESLEKTLTILQVAQSAVDRRQDEEAQRAEGRLLARLDQFAQKLDRLIEQKR